MVTQYSRLRLTFSGDRLPALAGLSKQMMHVREGKCLAGVWEDSLFEDLCWQTARGWPSSSPSEGILTPKDAGAYIAPSWSWAPVLVPVEYINDMTNRRRAREFVPDAKLIRVKVVNVDPHDPTGQVVSCLLKLSATWTETYPDKNKRWPPGISKDVYYVLLAIDGSARYWLVLERAGNEHYRRMDLTEGYRSDEPKGLVKKGPDVFTIIQRDSGRESSPKLWAASSMSPPTPFPNPQPCLR